MCLLAVFFFHSLFSVLVHQCFVLCFQRMEFLAALEMALEQYPVGLQLAHVDRDFNE